MSFPDEEMLRVDEEMLRVKQNFGNQAQNWRMSHKRGNLSSKGHDSERMGSKHRRKSKTRGRHASSEQPTPTTTPTNDPLSNGSSESPAEGPDVAAESQPSDGIEGLGRLEGQHPQTPMSMTPTQDATIVGDVDTPYIPKELTMTREKAKIAIELMFVSMLAASLAPLALLRPFATEELHVGDLVRLLEGQTNNIELSQVVQCALSHYYCDGNREVVDVRALMELASAATFRVEMLEFQIRQAIINKAINKSRAAVDVQRAVSKLASHLSDDTTAVSAMDFEAMLEEKLGVTSGSSVLCRVVFARITRQPFAQTLPKSLKCPRSAFFAALELFVADKPLSMEFVEGQLRHLVSTHVDLRSSFRALDVDSSGSITLDEFVSFLQREAQMDYPRDVIAAFIERFDVDGDGTLSYEEFVDFVSPKQFGIQVLTPFGMFYHASDRREPMGEIVAKIKTRMFWMQHNDLFSTSSHPVHKPPLKLKVTDHFILTHHYGTLRLRYKASDPIAKVLKNGEMVVLVREPDVAMKLTGDGEVEEKVPAFEYRLKPKTKRSIPPLMTMTLGEPPLNAATLLATNSTPLRKASQTQQPMRKSRRRVSNDSDDGASVVSTTSETTSRKSLRVLRSTVAKARQSAKPNELPQKPRPHTPLAEMQLLGGRDDIPNDAPVQLSSIDSISSPVSFPDYEYFNPNPSSGDDDDDDASDIGLLDDNSFGDESAPPCVGDTTVFCDEDVLPPPYDG